MSERGGERRPAVRDLDDLLADAVDRALVALESGGLESLGIGSKR